MALASLQTRDTSARRSRPAPCRRWAGAVLALAVLATTAPAAAQGTSRVFPDPMSFEAMSKLLAPLGLSEAQRKAAGFEHARYLEEFRVLRGGAIESYLTEFGSYPLDYREDRDEIIDGMKRHRVILRNIQTLDTSFFGSVETVLSDEQKSLLPRMVARRERRRLSSNPSAHGWELPSLGRLDLSAEIDDLELPDDRRAEIDPLVATYESSLTPLFRKIHAKRLELPQAYHDRTWETRRAFQERMEALQARFDLETPEGQKEYAEAVRDVVMEDSGGLSMPGNDLEEQVEIREEFVRVSRLDRRLLTELRGVLEADEAADLERRVTQRAFGMLGVPGDPVRRRVAKHLEDESTPVELRAALEELQRGYRESRVPLVDRLIVAAEQAQFDGVGMNFFQITTDGQVEQRNEETPIGERRKAIRELNDRTLEAYATLTGEEIETRRSHTIDFGGGDIGSLVFEAGDGDAVMIEGDGEEAIEMVSVVIAAQPIGGGSGGDGGGEYTSVTLGSVIGDADIMFPGLSDIEPGDGEEGAFMHGSAHPRPQGWLPGPIGEDVAKRLADDLGLDDSSRPLLDALYDDYRDAFRALDEQVIRPARNASRSVSFTAFLHSSERAAEPIEPAEAFDRVRSAMDAIAGVDRQFFDDLDVVVTTPNSRPVIDRAIRARRRDAHDHLGAGGMFGGFASGSREDRVDLVELSTSRAVPLASDDVAASRDALHAYDVDSVTLYADRWGAKLDSARDEAERMRESMKSAGEGTQMFISFGGGETDGEGGAARRRAKSAERSLRDLNLRTLPVLAEALSETGYAAFRDAYHRKAFPAVFHDRSGLERMLKRALELEPPAGRRQEIEQLLLDYRGTYAAICDRMIERVREYDRGSDVAGDSGAMSEESFKRYEALQRGLEADRFERRNLDERTRQTLRDALGERAAEVGLVAEDG